LKTILGDTIERNISKRVFLSICIVAIAISLLDFLFTLIAEISDLTQSYGLIDALTYSVKSIPGSIYAYLSYICLLGVLIGLGSLKEDGEIIASKVLGKSNFLMVIASLRPATLIIIIGLIFQELYLPSISQSNEETRLIKQNKISTEEGYWFASASSINFFGSSPNKNTITDITIYVLGNNNDITKEINSKSASQSNGQWTLNDIRVYDYENNSINYLEKMNWEEGPNESEMRRVLSPKYFSIRELDRALDDEGSEFRQNKLLLEYWRKVFHPLTTILLILLAASFVFGSVRDDSLGRRILVGVLFAFSLNTLQSLFESMAAVSLLNPLYSVLIPMLLVLFFTILLWKLKPH
tara:strand:+ start:970 stop:2028 length:1059 start_codon:yes stop_codon:yes gene_type:complete